MTLVGVYLRVVKVQCQGKGNYVLGSIKYMKVNQWNSVLRVVQHLGMRNRRGMLNQTGSTDDFPEDRILSLERLLG